ncbi:uncharacterized protein LOC125054210 [Pieris napi]|uniref:uncharacterized protein LOC125054210 n=1 Tax=Pieris napi TaxID=78633 RepID=UPI001FBBCEBA|nr:uncharacterized protein LOC125054210 [Pieris napi]
MDLFNKGMKGPTRPAPVPPGAIVHRYSPVTNLNDDPFGSEVFEPSPMYSQKKKPPPRPPPPKINKQPEVPAKPIHFMRRPTVLTSLLNRKNKNIVNQSNVNPSSISTTNFTDFSEVDNNKMFSKCERTNTQTATLIDFSSPPSSPTFTTRSSSDGISVDSFGSDATTSTSNRNAISGGNASQAESGFEDDFDLFLTTRKQISKEDTLDDFSTIDPFSPQPVNKPPIMKKPLVNKDLFEICNQITAPSKGPTIIRAKPARPKPPDNSALLKSSFGNSFQMATMNINTTTPIQRVTNGFEDNDEKLLWDRDSPEREKTPPMPTIPPPPPPVIDDDLPVVWPDDLPDTDQNSEPYAVALFDYFTGHSEDLYFSAGTKIILVRRVNEEWLHGKLETGADGLFPSNYVEIKVPLNDSSIMGTAVALYDFAPVQNGDLQFNTGDNITVLSKISDEWYFGECNGIKGQFPVNYVQIS